LSIILGKKIEHWIYLPVNITSACQLCLQHQKLEVEMNNVKLDI